MGHLSRVRRLAGQARLPVAQAMDQAVRDLTTNSVAYILSFILSCLQMGGSARHGDCIHGRRAERQHQRYGHHEMPDPAVHRDQPRRHRGELSYTEYLVFCILYHISSILGTPARIRHPHQRRDDACVVSARRVHQGEEILADAAGTRAGDH